MFCLDPYHSPFSCHWPTLRKGKTHLLMKTILVPTDLSQLGDSALRVAADIARTYNAEIVLVHYLPLTVAHSSASISAATMTKYQKSEEDKALAHMQTIINGPAFHDVTIKPVTSRDEGGLFEIATEQPVDLIVLATHGTSGWDEWLFGSNAEHVVRFAHCPVLVVKQATVPFDPTNVFAAIDVDDKLKHCWPAYPFVANGGLTQFLYIRTPDDNRVPEGIQAWMGALAQEKGITNYELSIRNARTAEKGILAFADERQADLIVVYTHGYTGLRHLFQGSVAEDVLNHATIPVLVLKITDV